MPISPETPLSARPSPSGRPPWSVRRLIYTGLGLGLAPKAPGTFGTLLGIPLVLLLAGRPWPVYLAVTLGLLLLGWWAAARAERDLGRHDAPEVVIDEVVGYLVTLFLFPAQPLHLLLGFVFFRFFDIVKPWPVRWADRKVGGAWGVMLDDLLAGVYAWLALALVNQWL